MREHHTDRDVFECVEPEVGRQLWRWAGPEATAEQSARREDHLRVCDACRLEAAVERGVAAGLADGTLVLAGGGAHPPRRRPILSRRRPFPGLLAAATGLVAAGLAMVVLAPPRAASGPGPDRSGREAAFVRPVEGETVAADAPVFHWRPVSGATAYELRVEEVDGTFAWAGSSPRPRLALPDDVDLVPGRAYRAYVVPVPHDLAPAGALSVRFDAGGPVAVLRYRAGAAPRTAYVLIAVGLLAGGAAVLARSRRAEADRTAAA